ncbi:MAG TPA: hypothetical protein DDX47_00400 [Candidatus Jacksonbacteria bacterium]|nr:MAG: hypothetical protein UW45_C0005G0009 [Parcubacteria group bacterium GW2011_GWC2_44_22]OGY76470.1 MAG: hypothetical protein A2295_02355 [Candidatus Jacksonbacteria bacterium RIFOXYB2_FULL_44_15]OGY76841.1 MAG: hypothetical protein A2240_04690 [Candidatus Jacksonbacteria bacterium RIFOXYA2_FULL_43_12]OGY82200.1 MAG: hypothetical protein A2550_05860 [Candidatus Jacksonbacteria bacterium RIFOXYD2_FULL_43_21]HBH45816.1 hypothetical protein [Candidatus Jacksonbacteria bacterium]
MSLKLRHWLNKFALLVKNKILINQNLLGDRDIEWSFVAGHLPKNSGHALDLGCRQTYLGLMAAQAGYQTIALDLEPVAWPYQHPNLEFIQGDILTTEFPNDYFDLIINSSSVEHIGLAGRYQINENIPAGDLRAMQRMLSFLKPGGTMLLTIPVGQDAICRPLHRIYGAKRLPSLIAGYVIRNKEFWIKGEKQEWIQASENDALHKLCPKGAYNLGCFVLQKPC